MLDRHETCIYVIGSRNGGPVRIGWSTNVLKRLRTMQHGSAEELEVLAVMRCLRCHATVRALQDYLRKSRYRGDWYRRTEEVEELISVIQSGQGEVLVRIGHEK